MTAQQEKRTEFTRLAEARYAKFLETGYTIPWTEMRRYLENRFEVRADTVFELALRGQREAGDDL